MRNLLFFILFIPLFAISEDSCEVSKWGKDDEIGAANLISNANTLNAIKLVKKGMSHGLGIVIEPGMPAFPPRYTELQVVQPNQHFGRDTTEDFGYDITYNDDILQMWIGTGPQLDGLGHIGNDDIFYNCHKGADFSFITGLTKFGIEKVPPLVGRGVVVNMAKYFGIVTMVGGQGITRDDIKNAAKQQNIKFQEGDIILFHTGWTDAYLKSSPELWGSTIPGITNDAAVYLSSLNPMAVGADTWGLGAVPPVEGDLVYYDHVTLIKENGIYILETMNTGKLAEDNVTEFLFVLGQPKLKGAVQMIINPVALW
ncbi:cyclase family protein [Gammaproteobacteria bacterium]|nr:cyclase family protein [Gammaproteobacteria bacterium]